MYKERAREVNRSLNSIGEIGYNALSSVEVDR
jgi:hypothetical protein